MMQTCNILVSGASGFIGRKLVDKLANGGHRVSALFRRRKPEGHSAISWIEVGDLSTTSIDPALASGFDVFINLAAPLRPTSTDRSGIESEAASIARNVSNFIANAGIPKIIILSSIASSLAEKEPTRARRYGIEKLAAEKVFLERLESKHQVVILRPPAVYGPGMLGSVKMLAKMVNRGLPIPLGSATKLRHYISIDNLCDLIETMVNDRDEQWFAAAGRAFEPSDGQPISTLELVHMMANVMGRRPRLLPVPLVLLHLLGAITGRSELIGGAIDRLNVAPTEELEVAFDWRPIERMPESLAFLDQEFRRA